VSSIQVADEMFVAAAPELVAAALAAPSRWRQWWPDLELEVRQDRGAQGFRWAAAGPIAGTMEVWLEPVLDGVVLHYFCHAEPAAPVRPAALPKLNRQRRIQGKRMSFEVKRQVEAGRAAGEPAVA
jgi:hypothetical protein